MCEEARNAKNPHTGLLNREVLGVATLLEAAVLELGQLLDGAETVVDSRGGGICAHVLCDLWKDRQSTESFHASTLSAPSREQDIRDPMEGRENGDRARG